MISSTCVTRQSSSENDYKTITKTFLRDTDTHAAAFLDIPGWGIRLRITSPFEVVSGL